MINFVFLNAAIIEIEWERVNLAKTNVPWGGGARKQGRGGGQNSGIFSERTF